MITTATPPHTNILTDLLSHLIRMPTVSGDHATSRAALDWVQEQLRDLPLTFKQYTHNGFPALVATTPAVANPKHPRLWLTGHMDVVPARPEQFEPYVKAGRLHGRGAHDMKFAIATFIALLQELGPKLAHYDLGLMITTDEEVGGENGIQWLLETMGYRGAAALIPDCNGTWEMEVGAKGIMWWELTATGHATHASRMWEGLNAIDLIVRYVSHLRSHLATEPCDNPSHPHTTLNLGTISGGAAANQVPDQATARIDIRHTSEDTAVAIQSWFNEAAVAVPGVKAKALVADPPYQVRDQRPLNLFERLTQEVTGHGVTRIVAHGTSDARFFARYDIPTVNITPAGGGYHVPDEWMDLEDLGRYYQVVRRFVTEWAGPQRSQAARARRAATKR